MRKRTIIGRLFLGIILLILCLCGCQNQESEPPSNTEPATVSQTLPSAPAPESTVPESTSSVTAAAEPTISVPEKKGDMIFTQNADDPFIQAIVQKYNVDPARLAGIYMSPASDSNYFWEFDGTVDANGKLVRNADTLKYVYTSTADRSKICRAGGFSGNDGLTAAQGYLVFETNKQLMLPKFEAQLSEN